ncbi:MAG TPA: RHS repeat-associated core domain-containing protein [Verrucomicrobiales bacterium]|nr:RHS repeat-associated core domain-containing protein [Verrucomicrobiales bacterium]
MHITDEAGNNVSTSLDDAGRRSRVQDRKLNSTFITYDPETGLPTEIRHPGNLRDVFEYSSRTVNGVEFQDLTRITRPDGRSDQFVHDDNGNLVQFVLRDAHAFDYGYNDHGQITSVTNPVGGEVALTYDASARLASATDSDVGATAYEYDSLHRLTQITHPNQDTVQFEYDALDRLTAVTDERANTTAFTYDDNSRLTNAVDALGQSTRFEYDSLDRLIRTVDRLGHGTHFAYDPRSDLVAVTNRNNFVTRFEYDERRRRTAVIDPAGNASRFGYDPEGLLISARNPLDETVSLTRDLMGYVTGITDPLGNRVGVQRDTMKRVVGFTNALGNQTAYTYTPRGQLSGVTLPGNLAASYEYDGLGSLTQISDPNNRLWRFTRTPMGRLASLTDPLNRTNLYTYDTRGRLAEVTFPDGVTLTLTYDGANNVIRRQYSDGTDLHYAHDELNRLVSASGSPVFEFTYDDMDRVTNTRQDGVDFGATYDADGRLTSVSYPGAPGFTVTYTYDSRDRLTSVSDDLTGTSLTFAYDDANRLTGITRPNGVNTTYTYDAAGRLTRIQDGSILDLRFTLDAAGQILETDYAAVPLDPAAAVPIEDTSFTYDNASQISTAGHTYDARGRQTASPGNTFTWDGASRLAGINAVVNGYNALGDLVTRVEGGNTNRYFYNYAVGLHPIMAERDENSGQFTRYYIWSPGGLLLYIINLPGNTVSFPHFDHVGSALALTGAGGTVTDSYAYDPYGKVLAQTGTSTQPFRFNGAFGVRTDGSFHHMRARWYDPGSARFLSKEPIWPVLESPQQLNVYAFANQNPLTFADPLGDEPATLTVGGLVVGWAAVMGIVSSATYIALNIQEQIQAAREIRSEAERQKKLEEKRSRLLRAYNRYRFMGERFGNSSQSTDPTDAQPTAPEAPAPVHPPAPDTGVAGTDGGPGETIPREYINLALECFQQYHREYVDNRRKQCLLGLGGIAPQNPSPQSQGADPGCPAGAVAAHGVLNYIDDPTATPSAGNPDGPGAATTGGYPRPQAGRFVDPPLKFRFSMGFRY